MEPLNSGHVQAYVTCVLWPELSVLVGADGVASKTSHCERLFQLPWQSAANCLKENFPLTLIFLSAIFLALNLACSAFINVKCMKGE